MRLVGFSCYIWNITKTRELIKLVRGLTDAIIVLGGPEVSYNVGDVLREECSRTIISGGGRPSPTARLDRLRRAGSRATRFATGGENIVWGEPYTTMYRQIHRRIFCESGRA